MKRFIYIFILSISYCAFSEEQKAEPLSKFVEGVKQIKDTDLQDFKRYVIEYYRDVTPLKSIKTVNGVIDCIPFEQQYSIRDLPEKEKREAIDLYNLYNRLYNKQSEKKSLCPAGYVPIPRISPTLLSDIDNWNKAESLRTSESQQDQIPQKADTPDSSLPDLPPGGVTFSMDTNYVYYWCTSESKQYSLPGQLVRENGFEQGTFIGLRFPAVPLNNSLDMGMRSNEEHSLFQLWISNMESGDPFPEDFVCLECGYKYETTIQDPVIFCFSTVTGYRENEWSGYNTCGKYFVMTSNQFNFEKEIAGNPLNMGFYYDNRRGWVFVVNGEEVGYYRKDFYKNKMESMEGLYINYGGEVCQNKDNKNTVLMGNGRNNIFGIKITAFIGYYVIDPAKVPESIKIMYEADKVFVKGN